MKDLKVKSFTSDPDALMALLLLFALALAPLDVFARVMAFPELFGVLMAIVFGGRYGLRMLGTVGTARVVASGQQMPGAPLETETGFIDADELDDLMADDDE